MEKGIALHPDSTARPFFLAMTQKAAGDYDGALVSDLRVPAASTRATAWSLNQVGPHSILTAPLR